MKKDLTLMPRETPMPPPTRMTLEHGQGLSREIEEDVRLIMRHTSTACGYEPVAVETEAAFILYRLSCRMGLHATGTESALLTAIARAEASLADLEAKLAHASRLLAENVAPAVALNASAKAAEAALEARAARQAATDAGGEALREMDAHFATQAALADRTMK